MFTDRVPASWRTPLRWLVDILMALMALFVMFYGTQLVIGTWNQAVGEFPALSVGVTYLPLPVGSFLTLLFVIEKMIAGPQAGRAVVTFDHDQTNVVADLKGEI